MASHFARISCVPAVVTANLFKMRGFLKRVSIARVVKASVQRIGGRLSLSCFDDDLTAAFVLVEVFFLGPGVFLALSFYSSWLPSSFSVSLTSAERSSVLLSLLAEPEPPGLTTIVLSGDHRLGSISSPRMVTRPCSASGAEASPSLAAGSVLCVVDVGGLLPQNAQYA